MILVRQYKGIPKDGGILWRKFYVKNNNKIKFYKIMQGNPHYNYPTRIKEVQNNE